MTWSYSELLLSSKDKVRAMIGDVNSASPLLTDEQINFAIGQRRSLPRSAAMCCRMIAAKFAREVSTSVDGFSASDNQKADAYSKMAAEFEAEAAQSESSEMGGTSPFADDALATEALSDSREPIFTIGMGSNPRAGE